MPYLPQKTLDDMLVALPDDQRRVITDLMHGKVEKIVKCNSDDQFINEERPVLDDDGNQVYYSKGKQKGQLKTETVKTQTRKGCNGRVIAYIYRDSPTKTRVVPANTDDVSKMWLFQSRPRLDGVWGFHCRCGQSSLLAASEQGIISSAPPSKSDLEIIWGNLQKNKPNYPVTGGVQYVDGFSIEEAK